LPGAAGGAVRVLVATKPVEFRKGMDGLAALVKEQLRADLFSSVVYVFRAQRADWVKPVWWEGTGLEAEFRDLVGDIRSARVQLQQLGGTIRARDQQDRWLFYAAGARIVFRVFLWVMMSGPIAGRLPWDLGEKMAARTLGLNRWQAGQQLMASANLQGWRRIAWAAELERANREALQACRERPKSRGSVHCAITVQPEGDGFGTAPR
jgi:hypothetical protein